MTILLESAIRVTLIAAIVALVLFAMRIKTAAVCHKVWASVVVLMLLLPAWVAWGPKAPLPVLPPDRTTVITLLPPPSPAGLVSTTPASPISTPAPSLARKGEGYIAIYLVGVGVCLLRLAIGTIRASRLTSASCVVPVTVGLLHLRIILPENSRDWPQAQLDAVLAHEGEHIRRRDPLFQWLALLNRALFWFHPLAWWLERRISGLAEEACDAAVIARGYNPQEYSEYLLDLARSVERAGTRIDAVGMAMPGVGLNHRIRQILSGVPIPTISRPRMACTFAMCGAAAAIFAAGTLVHAQSASEADAGPQFEVETIKPTPLDYQGPTGLGGSKGRLTITHYTLKQMMKYAYVLHPDQIVGPDWINETRYDVVAKLPVGIGGEANIQRMIRRFVADRFGLTFHRESRQMSAYTLTVAKGGPKLRERQDGDGGPGYSLFFNGPRLPARKATMAQLVMGLQGLVLDHPVIDETGLKGAYDFDLVWTPDETQFAGRGGKGPYAGDPDGPSIFTAVQEQLGLKLNGTKAQVEVLIVDHAHPPSEN